MDIYTSTKLRFYFPTIEQYSAGCSAGRPVSSKVRLICKICQVACVELHHFVLLGNLTPLYSFIS